MFPCVCPVDCSNWPKQTAAHRCAVPAPGHRTGSAQETYAQRCVSDERAGDGDGDPGEHARWCAGGCHDDSGSLGGL